MLPNFFIIGAPKCGTSSLAKWLSGHEDIYMSKVKEPHFFNSDMKHKFVNRRDVYEGLFGDVEGEKAIGEASVWYLYSKEAVRNIEKEVVRAKYIVMLRNPVKMAPSLHEQQVVNGNEPIKDFNSAWFSRYNTSVAKSTYFWTEDPELLVYQNACLLGGQVEDLLKIVPRERVHFIILDDLKEDPRAEYLKVLRFLGVSDDGKEDFSIMNSAKVVKYWYVAVAVRIASKVKRGVKFPKSYGLMRKISLWNRVERARPIMDDSTKKDMVSYFYKDIEKLEKNLGVSLDKWKRGE